MQGSVDVTDEVLSTEKPLPTPEISRLRRIRTISLRITLAAAALLAADTARVIVFRGERPEPVAAASSGTPMKPGEVSRDTPLPELFEALRNPEDASEFLKKHLQQETPDDPLSFTSTFRMSASSFLEKGKGCCNNYAQFWGELWQATGRTPYLVSMWPTDERCAERRDQSYKDKKGWHMIAVFRTTDPASGREQLVIGDNDSVITWEGTLEQYVASKHMEILPVGGVHSFSPVRDADDFRAKIWDMNAPNAVMAMSPADGYAPAGMHVAAR